MGRSSFLSFEWEQIERGRRLADNCQYQSAMVCLEKILHLPELAADAREATFRLLAQIHFETENYLRARRYWSAVLIMQPTDPEVHFEMARSILAEPDLPRKRAWNHLHLAVALQPQEAKYWSLLAKVACEREKWQESLRCVRKCLCLQPTDRAVWQQLGETLARLPMDGVVESLLNKTQFVLTKQAFSGLILAYRRQLAIQNCQPVRPDMLQAILTLPERDKSPQTGDEAEGEGTILRLDSGHSPVPRLRLRKFDR